MVIINLLFCHGATVFLKLFLDLSSVSFSKNGKLSCRFISFYWGTSYTLDPVTTTIFPPGGSLKMRIEMLLGLLFIQTLLPKFWWVSSKFLFCFWILIVTFSSFPVGIVISQTSCLFFDLNHPCKRFWAYIRTSLAYNLLTKLYLKIFE